MGTQIDPSKIEEIRSDKDLRKGFDDKFATDEQNKRDEKITELLNEYVGAYEDKVSSSLVCRYLILVPCMLIIVVFSLIMFSFASKLANLQTNIEVNDLVAFVTACVSFVSLIIGLLTIITKYFFPENDERYITPIVKAIQKNDLENKKLNAKNSYQIKK